MNAMGNTALSQRRPYNATVRNVALILEHGGVPEGQRRRNDGVRCAPRVTSLRRRIGVLLWLLPEVVLGATIGCGTPHRPDVIILVIDALRADHLSCDGYQRDTTPAIDRFAEDSVRFSQAISQSTFTGCSIASLFTGRYPHRHGLYWGSLMDTGEETVSAHILGEGEVTIAEILKKHGYDTGAWLHNRMLRQGLGFDQGFDVYHEQRGSKQGSTAKLSRQFLAWAVAPSPRERPFFAYLHVLDLHDPYLPPPPFDTRYGSFSDVYSEKDLSHWGKFLHGVEEGRRELSKAELDQLIALYDGELRFIDNEIGQFLRLLRDANLYDRSLIILTADHGDGFMEHGFLSHSRAPYDELCHVPLIIKFPGQRHAGHVVASQVRLIDIMPTVLDVVGVNDGDRPEMDGASLVSLTAGPRWLQARKPLDRPAITEILLKGERLTVAVRDGHYKFIMRQGGPDEFYDLKRDPGEKLNLAGSAGPVEKRLQDQALRVINERSQGQSSKAPVDAKTLEDIRALGYVE